MSKKLGIATYIDNTEKMLEEFGWLYKSWIYSGCWKTTNLIVVHHPGIEDRLPDESGVILIPFSPLSRTDPLFHGYHFINSIAGLSGPHIDETLLKHEWILRTDADVFLTHHLVNFEPAFPVHGRGNYHFMPDFREKMLDFCQRHQVVHHQRFGCGHSILLRSDLMVRFLQRQMYWARKLAEDFGEDETGWGKWPGWYRGVLTMYAAEITANECSGKYLQNARERILDMESNNDSYIDSLTLHIHATPGNKRFCKFHYREGQYRGIQPAALDLRRTGDYCLWLAMASVQAIKVMALYPE